MQTIAFQEPRTVTRMAFQLLISTAVTEGVRQEAMAALQWYELKWQAQDAQARKAAQEQAQTAQQPPTPATPRVPSAVEQFGHNSPQAEAKRQKRLAEEEAKREIEEDPWDGSEEDVSLGEIEAAQKEGDTPSDGE